MVDRSTALSRFELRVLERLFGFDRQPLDFVPRKLDMLTGDDVTLRVRRAAGQRGPRAGYQAEPWVAVLRRDPCSYCGGRPSGTVDHLVAYARGGPKQHRVWNSAGACPECNATKGGLSLLAFLAFRAWGAFG